MFRDTRKDTLKIPKNNLADLEAKTAAESGEENITATEKIQDMPVFSEIEERKFLEIGGKNNKGKWVLSNGIQFINKPLARKILGMHNKTH